MSMMNASKNMSSQTESGGTDNSLGMCVRLNIITIIGK